MAARSSETTLSKVRRYWTGRAPDWAVEEAAPAPSAPSPPAAVDQESTGCHPAPIDEEEDDDAREERRRWTRERALRLSRQQEEELLLRQQNEQSDQDDEMDSDSGSGSGSDSESEQMASVDGDVPVPLFIPRPQRGTIGLKEEELQRRRLEEELTKKRLEDRKVQTRQILLREITKAELLVGNTAPNEEATNAGVVDTDDEVDQAEEHESWRLRELARIKRSRQQSCTGETATEEDNQVADHRPRKKKKKTKKQMRFMQRYYHKGCFFQDDAADGTAQTAGACEIYRRDFSGPTGLDNEVDASRQRRHHVCEVVVNTPYGLLVL
ncbi:microfibrillar-associated protein 1A-like [Oryza brachyantha]|uniref:microfibrillar-associated protein 1A-like n=1 Tax=Oryza brachyantha TaxID=4533 RepID=UPI001AD9F74C|nr:microfibrillar-associated protein 1A-like [Oryza brachyantha]